jgi:ABC-type transport system involved in multi-copper enzyme maturation permease subunit
MHAELLKLRALPTPRWTLAVCLAAIAIALIVSVFVGVGKDDAVLGLGAEIPTAIAGIILGAWIVGLEYGQSTMRRTLTADPRRARVFGVKLGAALVATTALTAIVFAVAVIVYPPIAHGDGASTSVADVLTEGVAALVGNLVGCVVGAAIALITRSMAGGVTVALLFSLGLDSALAAIPTVGDYSLQHSALDIYEVIRNTADDPDLLRAIAMTIVWTGGLSLAGLARFTRSDVR